MDDSYKKLALVAPASKEKGTGAVYRSKYCAEYSELQDNTTYGLFMQSVKQFGTNNCLGQRKLEGDKWTGYQFYTYNEVAELTGQVATVFAGLGMTRGDRLGIYGPNSVEWMISLQVCNRQTYACVPLYDTLGEAAVKYQVDHAEISVVVTSGGKLPELVKSIPNCKQKVKAIVYWGTADEEVVKVAKALCTVMTWDEVVEQGKASEVIKPDEPKGEDVSTIMYTSGTTGDPKGVVITHENLAYETVAVAKLLAYYKVDLKQGDTFLSYLPMAHIMDRVAQEFFLHLGLTIGYWRGDITLLLEDIAQLKPAMFIGAPRVFDRIRSRTLEKVKSASSLKRKLFNYAYNTKRRYLENGKGYKSTPLIDKVVFSAIKKTLGGKTKIIVSGSAPISRAAEEFLHVTTCTPVIQGYGLTETCAGSLLSQIGDFSVLQTVGFPLQSIEFRLQAVPEMEYSPFNKQEPKGEICFRGKTVFKEYYKDQKKTEESFDEDGFFHTGDVAEITADGDVKIVDRIKNIFKLSQGEYVAAEKLESEYKQCDLVDQIFVHGESTERCLIAVVVPSPALYRLAQTQGMSDDKEEVCASKLAKEKILEELNAKAKEKKLKGFEVIKAVHLEPEEWTIQNDFLTPSYKPKRPQLKKRYMPQVLEMYQQLNESG